MTVMVGLNIVIAAALAFTAALSAGASIGMRGNRPTAWLALALFCGSIQTVVMTLAAGSDAETLAAAILAPLAYLAASTGIRAMPPSSLPGRRLVAATTMLSGAAVLLIWASGPYVLQLLAVQLACAVPVIDAAWQMVKRVRRRLLDAAIVAGLVAVAICSLVRIPILLFYFGPDITPGIFRQSAIETVLMSVSGLIVPPVIFLLLARNIADTLAAYQQQSEHDGLTGLLNRRGLDTLAARPIAEGGAVIFCDIDHFKRVNDLFGHQAGDEVIRTFAEVLGRAGYPSARMGGEEFAVLLAGRGLEDAVDLAEMFRARFSTLRHAGLSPTEVVTASFGVAPFEAGQAPASAFGIADLALYLAKNEGRNRVVAAPSPTAPAEQSVA